MNWTREFVKMWSNSESEKVYSVNDTIPTNLKEHIVLSGTKESEEKRNQA